MMYQKVFILFLILTAVSNVESAGCTLLYKDFPVKESVFLDTSLDLIEPKVASIDLETNENLFISCPGPDNVLEVTQNSIEKAECVRNDILKVRGREYSLSKLGCSKAVSGGINRITGYCGNTHAEIISVGHNVTPQKHNSLFHICYDKQKGEALYSEHIIYGAALTNAKKNLPRPSFKVPGMGPGVTDNAYKQATQKLTFTDILGSESLASDYINTGSYLARGHLSPDADFIYASSSFSTYFYINTVPQWQAVNNGNWKSVETAVRNTAANLKKKLRVITGGHGVLSLNDSKGNLQNIFLVANNKLPVPKFSWKVVQDSENKKAIAFVTHNNPFVKSVNKNDYLCNDICDQTGWGQISWSTKPSKGITYCCDVNQLRNVIRTIPDVQSSGILEASNKKQF